MAYVRRGWMLNGLASTHLPCAHVPLLALNSRDSSGSACEWVCEYLLTHSPPHYTDHSFLPAVPKPPSSPLSWREPAAKATKAGLSSTGRHGLQSSSRGQVYLVCWEDTWRLSELWGGWGVTSSQVNSSAFCWLASKNTTCSGMQWSITCPTLLFCI